jgi:hypothetical protein
MPAAMLAAVPAPNRESDMTPERTLPCYTIAVATALASALGAQLLAGIASGEGLSAFRRELVDLGTYWLLALPVCYLVAGVLGYLGRVRTWRWILTMIAIQSLYGILAAGSGLSLLPLALVMTAVIALPGLVTGWLGGLIRRRHDAAAHG